MLAYSRVSSFVNDIADGETTGAHDRREQNGIEEPVYGLLCRPMYNTSFVPFIFIFFNFFGVRDPRRTGKLPNQVWRSLRGDHQKDAVRERNPETITSRLECGRRKEKRST